MPRAYMTPHGHARVSFGFFGTLVVGFLYLMSALLFVGLLMFVAAAFLVAIVVALTVHGVDRLLLAVSPKWRATQSCAWSVRPDAEGDRHHRDHDSVSSAAAT